MDELVASDEASVGQLLRSSWRFTEGRRWRLAVATVLALGLFAVTAVLPLLTGRLLDTALSHANASEQAQRFVREWLAIQGATRQVLADEAGDGLDARSVARGAQAATAQAIAARPDEYLEALFPSGFAYDVSGELGRRMRAQFEDGGPPWVARVNAALATGELDRASVAALLDAGSDTATQQGADAFSFVVANLSLEDAAAAQRDQWRRGEFIRNIVVLAALIATVALLRIATLRLSLRVTFDGSRRLQDEIFERVHDTNLVESGALGRPSMVSRCTGYVEHVQSALTQLLTRGIPSAANLVLSIVILLLIDPGIGALMCGLLVAFECVRRVVSPHWSRAVRRKLDDNTLLSEVADDAISNIRPIRSAGAEPVQRRLFARRANLVRRHSTRIETISEGFDFAAFAVGQFGVLLSVAVIGFARSGTTLGDAAATLLYVRAMSDAIGALPAVVVSLQEAAPYMRRLDRVLKFPLRRPATAQPLHLPAEHRSLVFDAVSFAPHDGSGGIHDIDLEVRNGEWRVLVAPQRSARDAVLLLASGLDVADRGHVRVGQTSLDSLAVDDARTLVSFIDSTPYIADTTLLENLRLSRPTATESDALAAAAAALLNPWIDTLEHGLDTIVGRTGHHVPRSEKVRIAIARTLVAAAPVVVIDDPTLQFDAESAAATWRLMRGLFAERCVLISTSRLELIGAADTISVLVEGHVAETGTMDKLLRHGTHWNGLWDRHTGTLDLVAALRNVPSLGRLPDTVLQRSAPRFVTETFDAGEDVFVAGELADRLFLIARGSIELWDAERRVATLHDGDHFGDFDPLLDAVSDSRRTLTAKAAATTTLRSLHRSAFTGGTAQLLDGPADLRAVYRHLARNGALDTAALQAALPHIDVESALDQLLVARSVTRSTAEGNTTWRIASEARRASSPRAHLLDRLETTTVRPEPE